MFTIEKNGKKIAEVCSFLEDPLKNKKKFVNQILQRIDFSEEIGYAGYQDKESLGNFLHGSIYGNQSNLVWNPSKITICKQEIEFVLEACSMVIQDKTIKIFLFPTVDTFVITKMGGVSGFTPWKNTVLL